MAKNMKEIEEGKAFAFLGIFLTVLGFIIVLLAKKDNKYAMYYAKQGLIIFIAYIILAVIGMIPFLGWAIAAIGSIALVVLWIIGLVNSLSGEMKPIPFIGKYAALIKHTGQFTGNKPVVHVVMK